MQDELKLLPAPPRTIGLLVVNYRTSFAVESLLHSLSSDIASPRLRISIWDNSCNDDEFRNLRLLQDKFNDVFLDISCGRSSNNLGYAGGNNAAWRALHSASAGSSPSSLIVVNPDVRLKKGSIGDLEQELLRDPNRPFSAPTVTSRGLLSGQGAVHKWTGRTRQLAPGSAVSPHEYVYPGGHFLALSGELWKRMGGFSEDFFLYCEEADLGLRLESHGLSSPPAVSTSVVVAHSEGLSTTSGGGSKSLVTYEHSTRSRIVLFRKHRKLRGGLLPMVVARILWAMQSRFQGRRQESKAILIGIRNGFRWQPKNGR